MKTLSLKDTPSLPAAPEPSHSNPDVIIEPSDSNPDVRSEADTEVQKSVLDDILVYPSIPESKKRKNPASNSLPKYMSGDQFVEYLKEKKDEKERLEREKIRRQMEREQKKKECELKKIQLADERKKKNLKETRKKKRQRKKRRILNEVGGKGYDVDLFR